MSAFVIDLEKIINGLATDPTFIGPSVAQYNSYDVSKTDTEYKYTFIATGVQKNDLNIEVVDNCIVLKAKPSTISRFSKKIDHLIYLYEDVDVENIRANLADGLLTLSLPKLKQTKKSVKVTIS